MTYGIVLDILYLIDVKVPSDSCAFLKIEKTLNVSVEPMFIHEKNVKTMYKQRYEWHPTFNPWGLALR